MLLDNSTLCITHIRTECESIETTVRTRRLLRSGALLRMGDHRLPKRVMSGEPENAEKRSLGENGEKWTDCVAEDLRLFGITGNWSTAALDPAAWYSTVHGGGCRFMAAWVKEEKKRPNTCRGRAKRKRRTRLRLHMG